MVEKVKMLTKDTLFVGLTRPTMVLGVPYLAFVGEVVCFSILFINAASIMHLLIIVPIHGVLYLIGANDPGIFDSLYMWTKTYGRCRNMRFWGAASFSPLTMRKWKD